MDWNGIIISGKEKNYIYENYRTWDPASRYYIYESYVPGRGKGRMLVRNEH